MRLTHRAFFLKKPDRIAYASICSLLFLYSLFKQLCGAACAPGGGKENRTPDPLLARQVLSQLSYTPTSLPGSFAFNSLVG